MKKNKTKNIVSFCFASIFSLFLSLGCDQLQSSLHDEMQADLIKETGSPSVQKNSWYYNGSSSTDLTEQTNAFMKIDFGKKVALKELVGKFLISYASTETGGNVTCEKSLNGGHFSSDFNSYYLDMTPVISVLDGKTPKDGKLNVEVNVSGFVCDEGDQTGRSVQAYSQKIAVKPLYSKTSGLTFGTKGAREGFEYSIPFETEISLSADAALSSEKKTSSFELKGLSEDKKSVVFIAKENLANEDFDEKITLTGILPASTGEPYKMQFAASFIPGELSNDVLGDSALSNYSLSQIMVYDKDLNLYVRVYSKDAIKCYGKHNITVLVDNSSKNSSGVMTQKVSWPKIDGEWPQMFNIASKSVESEQTSVDAEISTFVAEDGKVTSFLKYIGEDGSLTYEKSSVTSDGSEEISSTLTQDSSWYYDFGTNVLYYKIPFEKIGASAGDTLRVCVIRSVSSDASSTGGIAECCPSAAVTLDNGSKIAADSTWAGQIVIVDMTKALEYTIE